MNDLVVLHDLVVSDFDGQGSSCPFSFVTTSVSVFVKLATPNEHFLYIDVLWISFYFVKMGMKRRKG